MFPLTGKVCRGAAAAQSCAGYCCAPGPCALQTVCASTSHHSCPKANIYIYIYSALISGLVCRASQAGSVTPPAEPAMQQEQLRGGTTALSAQRDPRTLPRKHGQTGIYNSRAHHQSVGCLLHHGVPQSFPSVIFNPMKKGNLPN